VGITIYAVNSSSYFKRVIEIFKHESIGTVPIYITLNKPHTEIEKVLREHGFHPERVFFIDCISKHVIGHNIVAPANCMYVDGPSSITAIGIAATQAAKAVNGKKLIFIDSISTMLMYNDSAVVGSFCNFLLARLRAMGVDAVVLVLESDLQKDVVKRIESLADEVKK